MQVPYHEDKDPLVGWSVSWTIMERSLSIQSKESSLAEYLSSLSMLVLIYLGSVLVSTVIIFAWLLRWVLLSVVQQLGGSVSLQRNDPKHRVRQASVGFTALFGVVGLAFSQVFSLADILSLAGALMAGVMAGLLVYELSAQSD